MNKLKTSLLILMLLASISASAGYAPDSVQIALKKMYPTAVGIAWSQDKAYYVADFMMNGFDTKVWFNSDAEWVMKQTDWETLDEVPAPCSMLLPPASFRTGWCRTLFGCSFPNGNPSWPYKWANRMCR